MDSVNVNIIKQFMVCPLCRSLLANPKSLPCLHTFCHACIHSHVERTSRDSKFKCPSCDVFFPKPGAHSRLLKENYFLRNTLHYIPPARGFQCDICKMDLEKSPAVDMCIECLDHLCKVCSAGHNKTRMSKRHRIIGLQSVLQGVHFREMRAHHRTPCPAHPDKTLELFCESCKVPICLICRTFLHENHKIARPHEALVYANNILEDLLNIASRKVKLTETFLKDLIVAKDRCDEETRKVTNLVSKQFEHILDSVREQRNMTLAIIKRNASNVHEVLDAVTKNVTNYKVNKTDTLNYVQVLLSAGNDIEKLQHYPDIVHCMTHISSQRLAVRLNMPHYTLECEHLPVPLVDLAVTHEPLEINHDDHFIGALMETMNRPSVFERFQLRTVVQTQQRQDVSSGCSGLHHDRGLFIVTDSRNRKVKVFDSTGNFKCVFDHGNNYLKTPRDVTGIGDGYLVTDDSISGIAIYNDLFQQQYLIRSACKGFGGICWTGSSIILACDGKLSFMDVSGKPLGTVDNHTLGIERFNPRYVTVNITGHVIATDWIAKCVYILSCQGDRILHVYKPSGGRSLRDPYGVCCDGWGHVIVADSPSGQLGRVHVLSHAGEPIMVHVSADDGLRDPTAVTVCGQGELAVLEYRGTIKIYNYLQM